MQPVPIDTCFHPTRVSRGDGFIYVPCGTCPACCKSFHSKWRNRIEAATDTHASTLFITLTYSNEYLPICKLDPETKEIISVTHTKFKPRTGEAYRHELLGSFVKKDIAFTSIFESDKYSLKDIPHYVISHVNDSVVFDDSPCFAICLKKDIQDFVKRLRTNLKRDSFAADRDTSFTFFICSEYGPDTFRPHYHGLLFFNDPYIASLCKSYHVHNAWGKSHLNAEQLEKECQFVSFGKGAASYTSKYVTCDDDVPLFLSNKFFKSFHTSSHSEPIGSTALPFSAVSRTVRETDLLHDKKIKDKDTGEFVTVRLPYPPSFWSRYFPKFLFHGHLPLSTISALYARIFELPLYRHAKDFVCPDLTAELNSKYHIGDVDPVSTFIYIDNRKDFEKYDLFSIYKYRPFIKIPYLIADKPINTYSRIFYKLVDDPNFIDFFLFGIPQNRTVVNKILRLRRFCYLSTDNWCATHQDYMYHFNLYWSKCFNNSLRTFYDNFTTVGSYTSFTPSAISEYYPSFYNSLPKDISAFDKDVVAPRDNDYHVVHSILYYGFNLSIQDFYDSSGHLLKFNHFNSPFYSYYRFLISAYFREFKTKRKFNYKTYGSGELKPP